MTLVRPSVSRCPATSSDGPNTSPRRRGFPSPVACLQRHAREHRVSNAEWTPFETLLLTNRGLSRSPERMRGMRRVRGLSGRSRRERGDDRTRRGVRSSGPRGRPRGGALAACSRPSSRASAVCGSPIAAHDRTLSALRNRCRHERAEKPTARHRRRLSPRPLRSTSPPCPSTNRREGPEVAPPSARARHPAAPRVRRRSYTADSSRPSPAPSGPARRGPGPPRCAPG